MKKSSKYFFSGFFGAGGKMRLFPVDFCLSTAGELMGDSETFVSDFGSSFLTGGANFLGGSGRIFFKGGGIGGLLIGEGLGVGAGRGQFSSTINLMSFNIFAICATLVREFSDFT
jgi:hypothetical protein